MKLSFNPIERTHINSDFKVFKRDIPIFDIIYDDGNVVVGG